MSGPRVLWLHRQVSAVGAYRAIYPARYLKAQGHDITFFPFPYGNLKPNFASWSAQNVGKFDIIIVDRAISEADLPVLAGLRHASPGARMIVDFDDDWTSIPWWNMSVSTYKPGTPVYETGRAHLKLSELTTVSTPKLAEVFRDRAHDITVCENGIDPADWEGLPVNPERAKDPHLRVLYGGASGHYGDMDEARLGLEAVIENPPVPWRLLCFGAVPQWIHEAAERHPGRVVKLPWVEFQEYPSAVAWGGFDVAIAPLAAHPFNEAKSNIKWLEAGVQKIPFLCSDVGPYGAIPRGTAIKVSNTPVQWAEGLRNLLQDAALRQGLRDRAYEAVMDSGTVGAKASQWLDSIVRALACPRIDSLEATRLPSERQEEPEPA